ncbi:methyltransferase [Thalassotalea hakodatensis]|uniref:methyltransferase n=1 Tax=Thalassotalea hakodatensis TaxID=3030492 RepID=UPI002572BFE9|nr:methyltransferase [Thalassotalea hakodatensis]
MFLTNLSQVLARHDDLLIASSPLLVNMPQDNFANHLQQISSADEITFYDTQYDAYLFRDNTVKSNAIFHSQYQSKTLHDLVIMTFPKSKKELTFTLAMLSANLSENARILIVGENKSGIKSISKLTQGYHNTLDKIDSARHCVLYELTLNKLPTFNLEDWFQYYDLTINGEQCVIAALPGVFSQGGLDKGTSVLFEYLSNNLSGHVLDFGTGAGVIATYLAKTNQHITIELADVSALALASAEKTLKINKLSGNLIATNSLSSIKAQYDHVVTNPPFHQGIKTHYAATESFLAGIHKYIKPNGTLTVVANSFLKYQPIMASYFKKVSTAATKHGFTVYSARK